MRRDVGYLRLATGIVLTVALTLTGCGSVHRVSGAMPATSAAPAEAGARSPVLPRSELIQWSPGASPPEITAPQAAVNATAKQYWHWRIETGGVPGVSNERWVGVGVGVPTYFVVGGTVHQADPADWGADRFMIEGRAFTYAELGRLPTDAHGISSFLWQPYPTTQFTPRIFGEAVELAMAPTPPAVLVAAYHAISQRSEVHYAGTAVDPLGRSAIVLVFEFDGAQNQLLVDPRTGAALANRQVRMADGSVQLQTVITTAEWTDAPPHTTA